ncbi:VOC family protein [Tundrisphaera lichenicola]|uniref:VOC family protein n=1 Tax=Tundrisphaera lichenicola TaxID=2029860 RepID=UPI003EBB1B6A
MAELFMVEVRVADRASSSRWYAEFLGLRPILDDPGGGFVLLEAGPGKVALKEGAAVEGRGAVRLVFRVGDVDAERARLVGSGVAVSEASESPEGYREIRLADPDGTPVVLFSEVASAGESG